MQTFYLLNELPGCTFHGFATPGKAGVIMGDTPEQTRSWPPRHLRFF